MPDALQPGLYFRHGERPPNHWALMVLGVPGETDSAEVGAVIRRLYGMWRELEAGRVRDLPGVGLPTGNLRVTLAYGPHVFALPGAPPAPDDLSPSVRFRSPLAAGGGLLAAGAGLSYGPEIVKNVATEAIAVQFTADTALAVNRAVVESWKHLHDNPSPVSIAGVFTGFQRDDARSWIDFHDGVSNIPGEDNRRLAIEIPSGLLAGGSTMCFIRLAVSLDAWRGLTRQQQELVVGRDKLSGCTLVGNGSVTPGCPFAGTRDVVSPGNEDFRETPLPASPGLQLSHIHRANQQHSVDFASPNSLRIFRQGYEFFEPVRTAPGFRVGLNFVSFQAQASRVMRMLTQPQWLGRTNFGGVENGKAQWLDLLEVHAAAMYVVPPVREGEAFPGARLFA